MVQRVSGMKSAAAPAAKTDQKKAKKADDGAIITPGPYDPDFGPVLNPRFDGQFSWDLTNHNYLNYLFGLVNLWGMAVWGGSNPAGTGSNPDTGNGNNNNGNGSKPDTLGGKPDTGTGNGTGVIGGNPNDSMNGFPPMFSNPGLGFGINSPLDFLGNPGQGSPFPFPPPYDPDLGPSLNPRFDGQQAWNLTNFDYLNGLLNGVNVFGQIINGFPMAGTTSNAAAKKEPADKKDDKKPDKKPKKA